MFTLSDLEKIVQERAAVPASQSYTAKLVEEGMGRSSRKMGEEAVETIVAALSGTPQELRAEAADLLYHLLVVLHIRGVHVADVMAELQSRTSQSGLAEKAARKGGG
jgi:phosphoribosyl-ATP pyrophosphohydrolase